MDAVSVRWIGSEAALHQSFELLNVKYLTTTDTKWHFRLTAICDIPTNLDSPPQSSWTLISYPPVSLLFPPLFCSDGLMCPPTKCLTSVPVTLYQEMEGLHGEIRF